MEPGKDVNIQSGDLAGRDKSQPGTRHQEQAEINETHPIFPVDDNSRDDDLSGLKEMPAASTKFGDELEGTHEEMEKVNRESQLKREEDAGTNEDVKEDEHGAKEKSLWNKIKDKAGNLEDDIKKAFE